MKYIHMGIFCEVISTLMGLLHLAIFHPTLPIITTITWIVIGTGLGFVVFGIKTERNKNVKR